MHMHIQVRDTHNVRMDNALVLMLNNWQASRCVTVHFGGIFTAINWLGSSTQNMVWEIFISLRSLCKYSNGTSRAEFTCACA